MNLADPISKSEYTFSICIMARNEENNIRSMVEDSLRIYAENLNLLEILIIDNASTDETSPISSELASQYPLVTHIRMQTNLMYSGGCRQALLNARGQFVYILDGDQQHPISQIARFENALNAGADLVFGNRIARAEPRSRIISSVVLKVLAKRIIGFNGPDVNCGIRGIRLDKAQKILPEITANFVNPEIYYRAKLSNLLIDFVEVDQLARPDQHMRPTTHNFKTPFKLLYQVLIYLLSVRKIV